MSRDIFIADAHLLHSDAENYRRLLTFLESQQGQLRTLYILGDLFEFWIGYRHLVFAPYVPILEALTALRKSGTQIVYVEGNHDFHLGPYFSEELDCRIFPDGGMVEIEGKKICLSHGDLINSEDKSYLFWRRFVRSAPLRFLMSIAPGDLTWRTALLASRLSQRGNSNKSHRKLPEKQLEMFARERMAEGCQVVITGHFHQPFTRKFAEGRLIGLGDWISQYSYAIYEDGEFELRTFSPGP